MWYLQQFKSCRKHLKSMGQLNFEIESEEFKIYVQPYTCKISFSRRVDENYVFE